MSGNTVTDMYGLLGVPQDADVLTIRRGYRERVRALRLDLEDDPEANDLFGELTHAYEVLAHPTSRVLYDRAAAGLAAGEAAEPGPSRELARIDGQDLVTWVLADRANGTAAAVPPRQDRLVRYVALVGFVVAVVFLASLLLHG
jgi:DnaJ-class molecular chaperone